MFEMLQPSMFTFAICGTQYVHSRRAPVSMLLLATKANLYVKMSWSDLSHQHVLGNGLFCILQAEEDGAGAVHSVTVCFDVQSKVTFCCVVHFELSDAAVLLILQTTMFTPSLNVGQIYSTPNSDTVTIQQWTHKQQSTYE